MSVADTVRVAVWAGDEITRAGLVSLLASQPVIVADDADVLLVAARQWTNEVADKLLRSAAHDGRPTILVIHQITAEQVVIAVHHRVVGVLSRESATAEQLGQSVRTAANGGGVLSPSLIGTVLEHVGELRRKLFAAQELTDSGLSAREIEVLRLLADGHRTSEIAERLGFSERTVKADIHQVMSRLRLRSRTQAIAYAVRAGAI